MGCNETVECLSQPGSNQKAPVLSLRYRGSPVCWNHIYKRLQIKSQWFYTLLIKKLSSQQPSVYNTSDKLLTADYHSDLQIWSHFLVNTNMIT